MNKIKDSPLWDPSILFEINDTKDSVDKACKARLDIFRLPLLSKYSKILYLDTDILIKEDLTNVFDICQEEFMYVLDEGKLTDNDHYYGGQTLFGEEINLYPGESGFTSGILLFPYCEKIRQLFESILRDMENRPHFFECYDQPYIVYQTIHLQLCKRLLHPFAVNNNSSITSTKTIHHFPGFPGFSDEKIIKMQLFLNELNNVRFLRGDKIISRTVPPLKNNSFSIVGACVSYQYFDTLRYMLSVNYIHFEKLYIITQKDDLDTIQYCKKFPNVEVLFYSFKNRGKAFDKFGALNTAQALMYKYYPDSWYMIVDSDILLPNNLVDVLLRETLHTECIYGGIRNNVYKTSELMNKRDIINSKENREFHYNHLLMIPNIPPFVLGCFQLYKKKVFHRDTFDNASYGDVCFSRDNFDIMCIMNEMIYFHLGVGGVNWSGKITSFKEDTIIREYNLYFTSHKECTNNYYNKDGILQYYSKGINIDDDIWTCSDKMRIDIANFFNKSALNMKIAEIGSHKGYSTRILSTLFSKVYSVDNSVEWIRYNKNYNRDMRNIQYVSFDIYKESWTALPEDIEVCFIDALHSYQGCKSDLMNAATRFKNLKYVIFDDYGVWPGVKQVVDEFVYTKRLAVEAWIGITDVPGPSGIVKNTREGVICSIQKPIFKSRFSVPINRGASKLHFHTNYVKNP